MDLQLDTYLLHQQHIGTKWSSSQRLLAWFCLNYRSPLFVQIMFLDNWWVVDSDPIDEDLPTKNGIPRYCTNHWASRNWCTTWNTCHRRMFAIRRLLRGTSFDIVNASEKVKLWEEWGITRAFYASTRRPIIIHLLWIFGHGHQCLVLLT